MITRKLRQIRKLGKNNFASNSVCVYDFQELAKYALWSTFTCKPASKLVAFSTVFCRKLYVIYTVSFSVIKTYSEKYQVNSWTIYFSKPPYDNFTKCLGFFYDVTEFFVLSENFSCLNWNISFACRSITWSSKISFSACSDCVHTRVHLLDLKIWSKSLHPDCRHNEDPICCMSYLNYF